MLSPKGSGSSSGSIDGRWEDVKVVNALEALIGAAAAKRAAEGLSVRRDLIIHIHDYVEINTAQSGVISKLRAVVDTMWQKGTRIVIVGSSASDLSRKLLRQTQLERRRFPT